MRRYAVAIILIFLCTTLISCSTASNSRFQADRGIIHLTGEQSASRTIHRLDGQWQFYWKQLIAPDQFKTGHHPQMSGYISLPGAWNSFRLNGHEVGSSGYATYRLLVDIDPDGQMIALKLPAISTSYRMWINGTQVAAIGQVGTVRKHANPQYRVKQVYYQPSGPQLDIVIQVSNFSHKKGGIYSPIYMGSIDQINTLSDRSLSFQLFMTGVILMMGLYHLMMFLYRPSERSTLFFAIFCLLLGLRALLTGEMVVYLLHPHFDWKLMTQVEYLTSYLALPIFYSFIYFLYPQETWKHGKTILQGMGIILACLVLFTPAYFFIAALRYYDIVIVPASVYLVCVLALALYRKRTGALLSSAAGLVFAACTINDILHFYQIIDTFSSFTFGLYIFVFAQSVNLSIQFSKAFRKVELLSSNLSTMNQLLDGKVHDNTLSLEQSLEELQQKNEMLDRMEASRRHLITNISHDLGTPITTIQGYISAILDGVIEDPKMQRHYLQMVLNKVVSLDRLIQDLFQLSKLEARQLVFERQPFPAFEWLERVHQSYELEVANADLQLLYQWNESEPTRKTLQVVIDYERMNQVFANLIGNAIKFTPAGGTITIKAARYDHYHLLIQVSDTGGGISENDLEHIFDRFYTGRQHNAKAGYGTGLGLSIAREIIGSHDGSIWAITNNQIGCTFCFTIPLATGSSKKDHDNAS